MNWRAAACGMTVSMAVIAGSRASDSPAGLIACRNIADASARLACYDRETAALAPPTTTAVPGATAAASTGTGAARPISPSAPPANPPPVLSPEQQFGMPERKVAAREVAAGTRAADAAKIEAHLTGISASADGRTVFTLDNAQVWRQLAAEGELLARIGDPVTISRGWLGSYWMQLSTGRGCKVTRLH